MFKTIAAASMLAALTTPAFAFDDWGSFYAEVYGGAQLGAESTYFETTSYPMSRGSTYGFAVGAESSLPGISFGADVMMTSTEYADFAGYFIHTLSLMGTAEYAVPVSDMFELYGEVGAGAIQLVYDAPTFTEVGWGLGYQAAIGARANLGDNFAIFTEAKVQNSFGEIETTNYQYGMPTVSLLAGLRVSN